MSENRALMAFRDSALDILEDIVAEGFEDLPELKRHVHRFRGELDQLEARAVAFHDEMRERAREELETAIPPLAS